MTYIFSKTPNGQQAMYVSHYEHIKELVEAQERMIKIAQENQEEHDIFVIAERSKQHSHTTHFPINSYLLAQYETQNATKLHTIKHVSHRVLNNIGIVYPVGAVSLLRSWSARLP